MQVNENIPLFDESPGSLLVNTDRTRNNEDEMHRNSRMALLNSVENAGNALYRDAGIVRTLAQIETYAHALQFHQHLCTIPTFSPLVYGYESRNDGTIRATSSDNRMDPQNMNDLPSEEEFDDNWNMVIMYFIRRALHRHVNDTVARCFGFWSTPKADANVAIADANAGQVTKMDVALHFLHNSQRAYWTDDILDWASENASPRAKEAIRSRILTFIPT